MEWKTVKLGDVLSITGGQLYKGDLLGKGNNLLLGMGCVSFTEKFLKKGARQYGGDCLEKNIGHPGDIILATRQQSDNLPILAMPAMIPEGLETEKIIIGSNLYKVNITDSEFDNRFIFWLLKTPEYVNYIASVKTGTTVKMITIKDVENYTFLCPPKSVRDRISEIFWTLDAKIENNNRINANLEAQAQALYKSWFVDFEPWGGVMPEDWKDGTVSDLIDLLNGFAFKSSDFVEDGKYSLITIKGVQDGKMTTEGADLLNTIPTKMPKWCALEKGDILLSLTGNVGRCCLVDTDNCLLNQRVAKLQPKAEYNRLFTYILFRQEEMKARMIGISRGTAQMNLSPVETGKLSLIIPSEKVLQEFGVKFNNIIDNILTNIEESQRLAQLRDTLLPKLMKGEIEV